MASNITLSAGVRQNLLSLQKTADLMATTQNRLATGKKVNSALDNPTNFFTSTSLQARAGDLSNLLDAMSNGIKTLEAADNGITSVTKVVENMQSLVRSARADKTGSTVTPGTATAPTADSTATAVNNKLTFDLGAMTVDITVHDGTSALSAQTIADAINTHSILKESVVASVNVDNRLVLQNKTTAAIDVAGLDTGNVTGAVANTTTLAAGTGGAISATRQSLMNQFNDLRTQLDKLAQDASYNGINLLNGDELTLKFNEKSGSGASEVKIQGKNADGSAFGVLTSTKLGIAQQTTTDFNSDTTLDSLSTTLASALTSLRTQASQYGTSLTTVQNRQEFTKAMINTLQTGADNLVLADTNEEAANMLALQTRQQLASTALSLASQADQQVLRLF